MIFAVWFACRVENIAAMRQRKLPLKYVRRHTITHTHAHTHRHTHTHSLTHTHVHSYTHTHIQPLSFPFQSITSTICGTIWCSVSTSLQNVSTLFASPPITYDSLVVTFSLFSPLNWIPLCFALFHFTIFYSTAFDFISIYFLYRSIFNSLLHTTILLHKTSDHLQLPSV